MPFYYTPVKRRDVLWNGPVRPQLLVNTISLVLEPGTSKISVRTSIYFHPMSGGQIKNSVQVYLTIYFGQVN